MQQADGRCEDKNDLDNSIDNLPSGDVIVTRFKISVSPSLVDRSMN